MTLPVLLERIGNNGYRARTGEPLPMVAEGGSREEAMSNLQSALEGRLDQGTELVSVDLPVAVSPPPWAGFAGVFCNDPDFQDVLRIIEENRQKMENDPAVL